MPTLSQETRDQAERVRKLNLIAVAEYRKLDVALKKDGFSEALDSLGWHPLLFFLRRLDSNCYSLRITLNRLLSAKNPT